MSRVLLVDDLAPNLLSLQAALGPIGAELVSVSSGKAALAAAEEHEFGVAVLDVFMPEMDGFDTARSLKQLHPGLPIIFLTAADDTKKLALEAYSVGAVDYLAKPVDPTILRHKVAALIGLQASSVERNAEAERKARAAELESQLDRQRALYAELFATAPAGVALLFGHEHTVEYANEAFRRLIGAADVARRPLFDVAPSARSPLRALFEGAAERGQPASAEELTLAPASSTPRHVDVRVVPLTAPEGALCVFCFDATEKVLARAAAQRANRVKDEFLTLISHELRTPLSAVVGWVSLLKAQSTPSAETLAKALDVIERNARTQARIIDEVLEASRILRGKVDISPREVDLAGVVREALEAIGPDIEQQSLTLTTSLDGADCRVRGDAHRLQQIVANLLSNAIKFNSAGGQVSVRLERRPSAVSLTISDSGVGIDTTLLSSLFEPFRQADPAAGGRRAGLGLGLTIVRELVELHGGSVWATSDGPGHGASLHVELPPFEPQLRAPAANHGSAVPKLAGKRVLVVEDGHDAREFFTLALESAGADVRSSASADAALEVLNDFLPEIIVSDLAMPVHDGHWLIAEVRRRLPSVVAVAVSATVPHAAESKPARGFDRYVLKPIDAPQLVEVVINTLESVSSRSA